MDNEARTRLKVAFTVSGKTAKGISQKYGWPDTYVSRVLTGQINSPDPTRLLRICQETDADIAYVLTGEGVSTAKRKLLENIAEDNSDVIDQVAKFVNQIGLKGKRSDS
jgi:transcriptional regulator with XRE-family HTH domain